MTGVHYEPIPPTIVDQRTTREGQYVLLFVPAETQADHSEVAPFPAFRRSNGSLPRLDAPDRLN